MSKIKPTKVDRTEFLNKVIENCERKIMDIELEIRLLERRKIAEKSEQNLLGLENQIRNDKDLVKFYSEKIEVAEDELSEAIKESSLNAQKEYGKK